MNTKSNKPLKDVRVIEVPYTKDADYFNVFKTNKSETNWAVENSKNEQYLIKLIGYYMYASYKG